MTGPCAGDILGGQGGEKCNQPIQPQEGSGCTADRVVGIIGIALFACCSVATGVSVGGGAGMPEEFPQEVKPEGWQVITSFLVYIVMLFGCIGMSLSRRWGMLLTGLGGIVLLGLTAYGLSRYPEQTRAMQEFLETADMTEEKRQGIQLGLKLQPLFIALAVLATLFYTVFSFLRLGGKLGPRPQ